MKVTHVLLSAAALLTPVTLAAESHQIDTSKSKLQWTGSKVVGGSHEGHIKIKEGKIEYKKNQPSSATILVDMTSITNTDLKDAKWNAKLVGHLKSDDFFSVTKHKEAKLVITDFKKKKGQNYDLKGKLTIKGITKPVKLSATTSGSKKSYNKVTANLEFDRTEFNVRYGSGKFFDNLGDKMISDKVQVKVELHLKKSISLGMK